MKTTHRDYADEAGDFNRLCRFITAHAAHFRAYSTWPLGRIVDWKYGLYDCKRTYADFCNQNAHLWFDTFDQLAGFAVCENGDSGFQILTLPGYRFLFEEMLTWVLAHWTDRQPPFYTEITQHQALEIDVLERRGFFRKAEFFSRRFDLTRDLPSRFPLEPGFTIVDMHTHCDYRAQRAMRAEAFEGKASLSEEEMLQHLKYYHYSNQGPIYHGPTDLCVMAPDGRFVSGCEALIDAYNTEADIERVCTHSEFRQRGFARAVIQECLYRLKGMGMRNAYIAGYSQAAIALYGSLGAVDEVKSYVYELKS